MLKVPYKWTIIIFNQGQPTIGEAVTVGKQRLVIDTHLPHLFKTPFSLSVLGIGFNYFLIIIPLASTIPNKSQYWKDIVRPNVYFSDHQKKNLIIKQEKNNLINIYRLKKN